MRRIRILLADDFELLVEKVRRQLADEFELVGSVNDGQAAIEAVGRRDPTYWFSTLPWQIWKASTEGMTAAKGALIGDQEKRQEQ